MCESSLATLRKNWQIDNKKFERKSGEKKSCTGSTTECRQIPVSVSCRSVGNGPSELHWMCITYTQTLSWQLTFAMFACLYFVQNSASRAPKVVCSSFRKMKGYTRCTKFALVYIPFIVILVRRRQVNPFLCCLPTTEASNFYVTCTN